MGTLLLGLAVFVAAMWTWLALRFVVRAGEYRPLRPDAGPVPPEAPPIDAVVPAHNEEAHIEGTVRDLLGQTYPRLTVTVVDDQSTDGTGAVLDRLAASLPPSDQERLRIVRGVERPKGWVGKTWALRQGVARTSAPWILFVDGDMGLHPAAVATAWKVAWDANADLVSFLPRTECRTFWQGTIGTAVWFIVGHVHALHRANDPTRSDALAAGGFILIDRAAYDRAGGHEAVRREIVEDIQLARRVKQAGGRLALRTGGSVAWTHMYGTFGDIWRGLRKNSYAGMEYMLHKFVFGGLFALLMAWVPWVALRVGLATGWATLWGVGLWGIAGQVLSAAPLVAFLRIAPWYALLLPLGLTTYLAIAASSVWHHHRGRVIWKDRTIPASVVDPARAAASRAEP